MEFCAKIERAIRKIDIYVCMYIWIFFIHVFVSIRQIKK